MTWAQCDKCNYVILNGAERSEESKIRHCRLLATLGMT